jgi:Fe2+ transport system protein FeoA
MKLNLIILSKDPAPAQIARPLSDLEAGQSGTIQGITGGGATTQRLLALGLIPGVHVRVIQLAPLGDPFTLAIDAGAQVSLRRADARHLVVAPDPEHQP